ncbi:RNA-guided endonuclease InsQ/TnpB family protein [Halovivax cerinus]|uniref:RNA-guided endonuclease InsQ/TnpB family protein n=1 Tax=Halovivax cerinus TaxID=1487865 RepID=A0ABD5NI38_9EURY|nr:transposase [Halovivax cerinus]
MRYNYRYRLNPSDALRGTLDRHRDLYRQVYNHFLHRLNRIDGTTKYGEINELPSIKKWWSDLSDLYSRTLQNVVERFYDNLSRLKDAKENGRKVGSLKWKAPNEYRSFTYRQSGFKLKNTSGQTVLRLSKIGEIPVRLHRKLPDNAGIKQVTLKKEPTGEWFAVLGIDTDNNAPPKPENPDRCVGIDVGILSYTYDSDGFSVGPLNLSDERERLERAQRDLSRKDHGSANYRKQQRVVARRYADMKRKRRDFLHRLSAYYAREYDLVAVEDLDAKGLMELPSNSRNRASASWGTFLRMLEYKCDREGTHFVAVDPRGTTKECSNCGVSTDKPLWVREHSCPSCGFEADRDANAALNILSRGLDHVGVVHSESTPVETALPTETNSVPAKRVVETGSPALKERTAQAVSE